MATLSGLCLNAAAFESLAVGKLTPSACSASRSTPLASTTSKHPKSSLRPEGTRRKVENRPSISAVTPVGPLFFSCPLWFQALFWRSHACSTGASLTLIRAVIQWGLTPKSAQHDPNYHPKPAFLHAILAKHRHNLQPTKLFSHITRPRLDGIREPLLVRTLYEFTGDCFALTLKGPDGLPDSPNSMMDYQGLVVDEMKDLLGEDVWVALEEISEKFVKI